jgi:translation initiation factor 1
MPKKKLYSADGIVYSTDLNFKPQHEAEENITLPVREQSLIVKLDTKHRGGKMVTLIEGFAGTETDLEQLGKQIKSYCGTGGSVKNKVIIIQGDKREKILMWLNKMDYKKAKKG